MAQAFCQRLGLLKADFGQQHGKLLAANAPRNIRGAQPLAQQVSQVADDLIAHAVAIGVIDLFKVVNVQKHQGGIGGLLGGNQCAFVLQGLHESAAVGQAGQGIGQRQLLQHALVLVAGRDILHQGQAPQCLASGNMG